MKRLLGLLFPLLIAAAFAQAQTQPGVSGGSFSANTGYNWGALQTFSAGISATTVNGVTITPVTTSTLATINIQPGPSGTGSVQIGSNQGTLGAESIAIGLFTGNLFSGGCGSCTMVGQSNLINNTTASGATTFGNDVFKFYTGNAAVTGVGNTVFKNIVSCNNCVGIGDGVGQNWTSNAGTTNSLTIVGGNGTFAGTGGANGILKDIIVLGAHTAISATVGQQSNIFVGDNILNTTFRNGSHDIVVCTNACDTAASGTSNTINIENMWTATGTDVPATSVTTVAGTEIIGGATGLTVGALATCGASLKGARHYVTDATAPTFLGTLTGGGAVVTPVFCNGSAWVAG